MAKLSLRQAALMLRRLGTGLNAGVAVVRLWELESSRGAAAQQEAAESVRQGITGGGGLAESMAKCNGFYPPTILQLVDIGERTGKLESVFHRLADHYDHQVKVRRTFLQSIAWPGFQLGFAIMIIGLLIWIIGALLPRDIDGEPIDILGFGLYGNKGLLIYLFIVGSVGGVIALVIAGLAKDWFGPKPLLFAMKIPVIGKCLETIAMSKLAWTLSLTQESGIDARRTMAMALRSTQSPHYTRFVERADKVILHGGEFHEALGKTGVIPDELLDTLAASEIAGTQAESMSRLSREYQQRAEGSMRLLAGLASGAVWLFVAALIIMMIFRLFLFYLGAITEQLP